MNGEAVFHRTSAGLTSCQQSKGVRFLHVLANSAFVVTPPRRVPVCPTVALSRVPRTAQGAERAPMGSLAVCLPLEKRLLRSFANFLGHLPLLLSQKAFTYSRHRSYQRCDLHTPPPSLCVCAHVCVWGGGWGTHLLSRSVRTFLRQSLSN